MKKTERKSPDQIINQGLYALCSLLGVVVALVLQLSIVSTLAGATIGFIVGFILSKTRPRYGEAEGLWKHINHFMLTQMDLIKAFTKRK